MSAKTQRERDLMLARIANKHGAKFSLRIILEARRAGIPISWAFALVEQETGFRNIFGCDLGRREGVPWCNAPVTKARVQELVRYVRNGGTSNGVGPTQLTSLDYIMRAEKLGGAHLTQHNIRVGMEVLHEKSGGDMQQAWKFNGAWQYQGQIAAKQAVWHRRLTA